MAMALTTDAARSQDQMTAVCPGLTARIVLDDYDGAHLMQLCTGPQGFSINGGVVNLQVYDNQADGIFHNAFDAAP